MPKLTPDETRFLVKRAMQKIPAGTLQAMQRGSDADRTKALDLAVDVVLAHFSEAGHEVHRPERAPINMRG